MACGWSRGALKLPDPSESVRAVRAYDLLPEAVVPTVGHLLPVLEIVVGLLLVLGLLTRSAAVVSSLLFVAFIVGISAAWARGLQIDCGCFGGGGFDADATAKYPWEIARDVGLLALSAWLAVRPRSRWALDPLLFASSSGTTLTRRPRGTPMSKNTPERREARKQRAAEALRQKQAEERRRRLVTIGSVVAAVVVIIGGLTGGRPRATRPVRPPTTVPAVASGGDASGVPGEIDGYGIVVGKADAPTTSPSTRTSSARRARTSRRSSASAGRRRWTRATCAWSTG